MTKDIKEEYEGLTQQLKNQLPIKSTPTRELVQELRKKNFPITLKTELKIIDVYNSGDISGIICVLEQIADEGLACGLTHLNFTSETPYYKEIIAYQIRRAKRIKKLTS